MKQAHRNTIIKFENFSFKYRAQTKPTLRDINLEIHEGEKILIAGPSGCGKSTIAHCINGLITARYPGEISGRLTVGGVVPKEEGVFGMSRKVGTVLQDTDGQFIGLTVAEDLAFALENDRVPQEEMRQKVKEVAELVDMTEYLQHSPTALSGGQKQRVSIGGVLTDEVPILVFDEPLANLDPATGRYTMELIDEICKKRDITVVIIEHRLEDVLHRDVDRIVVMSEGRIVADMSPEELLSTEILNSVGVREPLYVSALKHAGANITPDCLPQHIQTMNVEPFREQLHHWYHSTAVEARAISPKPLLEVKNLSFAYDEEEPVLQDVSFTIHEGEMISLVGRNGAGKSTLASLICGFHKPVLGEICLEGEDMTPLSIKERGDKIGLVMQSPNQMISKPMVFEETALGLKVRGVAPEEIEERVNDTLKICGLYPMRNWPISALSFGQKKRVSIASILVMKPKVLILDEPTAGQDYRHYTEIMEFLKRLNQELGLTILMITHDMHLMLEYTDRAMVLADGKLLADDLPSKILTDEELAKKAYLKKTSLYDLAKKAGISDYSDFCQCFMQYERNQIRQKKGDV
ncbi:MAG: ABC transporter ATP-binding protein [Eubacteriales bacterium]|nr:ABC transporter ATP-binding protein [Eubacteriales bacterium]